MQLLLLASWLLLSGPAALAQAPRPLPPVPDSLQGLMRRAGTPASHLRALQRVANAYFAQGDSARTLAYARAAEAAARQLHDQNALAAAWITQSNAYLVAGQLSRALRLAQQALSQRDDQNYAADQLLLGLIYTKMGRPAEALGALRAAHHAYSAKHDVVNQLRADNARGLLYLNNALPDSAEFYLVRAARGYHQLPGYTQKEATALSNLAAINNQRKQYALGAHYARQALALHRAGHDSTYYSSTLSGLVIAAMNTDSLPQAVRYARQCLWLSRRFHNLEGEQTALNNLGTCFRRLHQPDSAEAYYQQALASTKKGGVVTARGLYLQQLASLYDASHRPAEALRLALEVAALDSSHRTPTTTLNNLKLLGKLALDRHDDSVALGYFQRHRALELRQAAAASSKQIAALRVSFNAERTEQQLALAQARADAQAQRADAQAQRATTLRLLSAQREATYRDTLSRRDHQRLLQQLFSQQQAAQVERAAQQVVSLTQRTRAQAQQVHLQQSLAAQQQQRLWTLIAVLGALLAGLAAATVLALRLRRSRNELAAARATQDRLYALVAHDLRSPVTAFEGLSDLLDHYVRRQDTAALAGLGGLIQQAAHSLRGLLENLLHWALHQRGELVAHPQPVPVADILAETVALYQATARAADITLSLAVAPELRLWADAQMSRTIVRNLVGNALKATPTGGRVTLTATASPAGTATIEVRDTGLGFQDEQLVRPAARRPQSAADRAGLGLQLSQAFAAAQGGALALRNAPGGGAVAALTLPVSALDR